MSTVFENPPNTAQPVLQATPEGKQMNRLSMSWYQWFATLAARLNSPVIAGTPANSASPPIGVQMVYDNSFLYINTSTGWKRIPLNTF